MSSCAKTYEGVAALARASARRFAPPPGLPAFFALTDPERTPDPVALARRLPHGSGLVLRHFGLPGLMDLAPALARIARQRKLLFLIANDPGLALQVRAGGVHWPEAEAGRAAYWSRRMPHWRMTASAHGPRALRRKLPVHARFLSPVFESDSPSAGPALDPVLSRRWARASASPVYALGGVDTKTLKELDRTVFSGACAVSAKTADRPAEKADELDSLIREEAER